MVKRTHQALVTGTVAAIGVYVVMYGRSSSPAGEAPSYDVVVHTPTTDYALKLYVHEDPQTAVTRSLQRHPEIPAAYWDQVSDQIKEEHVTARWHFSLNQHVQTSAQHYKVC